MKRTFEQYISEPLSQMILKREVKSGQAVRASASGDAIRFEIT
jgi:ATP-dependent Clp protease ATP-binding subunit ClpA